MYIKDVTNDVWLLTQEAYSIYAACMGKPSMEMYAEEMQLLRSSSNAHVFTMVSNDETVGMIALTEKTSAAVVIEGIAVREDRRRQGIALRMVHDAAQMLSVRFMEAETDEDAVGFYRAAGFRVEGFVRHFADGDCRRYHCLLDRKSV